jgi:hypothetical protein
MCSSCPRHTTQEALRNQGLLIFSQQGHSPELPRIGIQIAAGEGRFVGGKGLHEYVQMLGSLFLYPDGIWNTLSFNNLALIATRIVLKDMNTAPSAGLSKIPEPYNTPAASGIAIAL